MATNRTGGPNPAKANSTFKAGGEVRKQPTAAERRAHEAFNRREARQRALDEANTARVAAHVRQISSVDRLDTSRQIDAVGSVPDKSGRQNYYVPFSLTERDYDQIADDDNAAYARGIRGDQEISSSSTMPLLRDENGYPLIRDNAITRMDGTSQRALEDFAQEARTDGKMQRRYIAYRIWDRMTEGGALSKSTDDVAAVVAKEWGVSRPTAHHYITEARLYMAGYVRAEESANQRFLNRLQQQRKNRA